MSRTDTAVRVIPPLRPTERQCPDLVHAVTIGAGDRTCAGTLEPFDRSARAPATAPASAARITPLSAAGLETRRRPAPTEPPNGAQQLRLIHGRVPNEDPLTGHRFCSCAKAIVQARRYLALALDEERKRCAGSVALPLRANRKIG